MPARLALFGASLTEAGSAFGVLLRGGMAFGLADALLSSSSRYRSPLTQNGRPYSSSQLSSTRRRSASTLGSSFVMRFRIFSSLSSLPGSRFAGPWPFGPASRREASWLLASRSSRSWIRLRCFSTAARIGARCAFRLSRRLISCSCADSNASLTTSEKAGAKSSISSSLKYSSSHSFCSVNRASSTNKCRFAFFSSFSLPNSSSNSLICRTPTPLFAARNCLRSLSGMLRRSQSASTELRRSRSFFSRLPFSAMSLSRLEFRRARSSVCSPSCSGASCAQETMAESICACGVPSSDQRVMISSAVLATRATRRAYSS